MLDSKLPKFKYFDCTECFLLKNEVIHINSEIQNLKFKSKTNSVHNNNNIVKSLYKIIEKNKLK